MTLKPWDMPSAYGTTPAPDDEVEEIEDPEPITRRDLFAAMAMHAFMAKEHDPNADRLAARAWTVADAMIAQDPEE